MDALEKIKDSIEKEQDISKLDRFGTSAYSAKKHFGNFKGRLITYERKYKEEYTVIIFLTVFIRSDQDYTLFQRKPEDRGEKFLKKIDEKDMEAYLENRIAKDPPKNKSKLTSEEEAYLYDAAVSDYELGNDELIYESEDWVKNINKFDSKLSHVYDTVNEILKNGYEKNEVELPHKKEKIIFIFDKAKKILSLLNIVPIDHLPSYDVEDIVSEWNKKIHNDSRDMVKRAYPQYVLADVELWMEIEKDPQSNFVLSKEEIEILSSCKDNPFPLFINGRAGSGKSTMLQYVFADYYSRYLSYKNSIAYPPAYFTYNSELLQRARTFVKSLIMCNTSFSNANEIARKDANFNSKLEKSFMELRTYLLSLIQTEEDKKRFAPNNHINYTRFRKLWLEKYRADKKAAHDYSPDISWHVIRTYIQGTDAEGYLEPDGYDELDAKQKSVNQETYKLVFNKVWNWYKDEKTKRNLWDDQDLVRHCLENALVKPLFPGIFCDEAQDFTRIELDVILRLSLFSDRDIKIQHISKVPFAFAGDELQTLNPTGFRWDALKAEFTHKFILSISTSRGKTELNYRLLENNYRSSPPIVKFCNALQLFRAVKFGITDLKPQKAGNTLSDKPVMSFSSNDAYFWEGIKKLPDTVFIIPCNEGEEIEWIKENKDLNDLKNNVPAVSILSANLAKGLEFGRVVVYGFGTQGIQLPDLLDENNNEDISATLPLQYYINKTYVALSRAKKQLFIVDSYDGERFWKQVQDHKTNSRLDKININSNNWSDSDLAFLLPGDKMYLSEQKEGDIEENALQFLRNGISTRESILVQHAAHIYRHLKQDVEADKYEAIANLFDGKYLEAGNKYKTSGWIDGAIRAFWLANSEEGYKSIIEYDDAERNTKYRFIFQIALAMRSNEKDKIVKAIEIVATTTPTNDLYNVFKGDDDGIVSENEMRDVLEKSVNTIVRKVKSFIDPNGDVITLRRILDIQNKGIKIEPSSIAEIAYIVGDFKIALEYWDKSSEVKDKEKYIRAQAYALSYPKNLVHLEYIGEWSEITKQYEADQNTTLTNDLRYIVVEAFVKQNKCDKVLHLISELQGIDKFNHLYNISSQNNDKKLSNIFSLLEKLECIQEEKWELIWKMLLKEKDKRGKDYTSIFYFVAALARTKSLVFLSETGRSPANKEISEYLRTEIIEKINKLTDIPVSENILLDIGTAIEKAGRWIDALDYYERIEAYVKDADLHQICIERWIITKERQAEHNKTSPESVKRKQEAVAKRERYNIPLNKDIEDYHLTSDWNKFYQYVIQNEMGKEKTSEQVIVPMPAIVSEEVITPLPPENQNGDIIRTSPSNEISQKQHFTFVFEEYKFVYFYQRKRMDIANESDGKSISITNGKYSSVDYSVKTSTEIEGSYQHIEGTPILFQNNHDYIEIRFNNAPLQIRVG